MVHELISGPINHRDASNTSGCHWKHPPTIISIPVADERPQRPHAKGNSNPYRMSNTLSSKSRPSGNPNVRQTVLAKPPDWRSSGADSRPQKRQKLDVSNSSTMTPNGASSSHARRSAPRSSVFEPDIQVIEPLRTTLNRRNPAPNDAEIIDIGTSSDDVGERVSRFAKSSSPDPIRLVPRRHPFQTHPTEYSSTASNKGKGRAKEPVELVEGSEEGEEIEDFTPPPSAGWSFKEPRGIPTNIVHDRKKFFESAPPSVPAATRRPIEKLVNPVESTTGTVISKMKKKDEGALGNQRNTGVSDRVGTSSSNFLNSTREKEHIRTLPLMAWCLGQHLFQHSESAPLKLAYEVAQQRIRVTWGRSPPQKFEFKLDRDVCSVMIVNESDEPLRENVVVRFTTTPGSTWREVERKYKGFKGGGERGKEALTFLFSTAKDRGFSTTDYQTFVTGIKKALLRSVVEIIHSSKGAPIWDHACRLAEMFELRESGNRKEDRGENTPDGPSALTRSATPCSSTSVRTGAEFKLPNGDPGPPMPHRRSERQSAIRTSRASPSLPPRAQLEPDEVVLIYPPTGTGALSIMHSDLRRLQPEEYLNDTLIEFGLKLWLNELRGKDPALADQIHVFSSFFYKKLNNRKNPEDGYNSVRKWTSKIDLFAKKYVIVPINENVHWYLAIIYEPGHTLEPPLPPSRLSGARVTRKRKHQLERANTNTEALAEVSLQRSSPAAHVTEGGPVVDMSSMDATRATTPSTTRCEDMEEMDDVAITVFDKSCSITAVSEPASTTSSEIQIRESSPNLVHPPSDSMDMDADPSVTDVIVIPNPTCIPVSQFYAKPGDVKPVETIDNEDSGEDQQQEAEVDDMLAVTQSSTVDLPQTYIFTLDSLGARHPQAIKVLKHYLASEAKDKRNFDEVRGAVGKQVQVPVQPNTWDCGIYLLHFVKVFMDAPSEFLEQILSTRGTMPSSERKKMWQDHEIPQFRDYLGSRIIQLSEEWKDGKTVREEVTNKRGSKDVLEVETLSSEGEVDIVEDIPSVKATPGPKQKQLAKRCRG
ncbi:hypothetical protein HD554DRAFT_2167133 [Boletus coccyginus]|nr:hypothetical protein HD554DRAFT_2167133 [Boletus coccyginus]